MKSHLSVRLLASLLTGVASPLILAALCLALPAAAQVPNSLLESIPPPPVGVQGGVNLGYSIATEGANTVVGVPLDGFRGISSGAVKVFDSTTGALRFVLTNPNLGTPAVDRFGWSVAISGTRVVVGALFGSSAALDAGSVYVYDLSSGTPTVPVMTLNNPHPAANDLFGGSVGISGTRVVVGAAGDDTTGNRSGIAFVYDLNIGTPTVPVATLNNPGPANDDDFGGSVGISGTRVVVGAPGDDTGATNAGSAYVYDLSSGTPTVPVAILNDPSPEEAFVGDSFGWSVAISGTRVVVGAYGDNTGAADTGSAYVYDLSSGTPTVPVTTLNNPGPAAFDWFGSSVAISGTRVVVGAYHDDTGAAEAGSAYVYDLSSGTPTVPVATLTNSSPAGNDQFGYSVAISGTRVAVGAHRDDTGATDAGSAYVYDLTSGTPTVPLSTLNHPTPASGDSFGWSVAISGTRVVVAAANAGSAHVYDLTNASATVPVATLNNPAMSEAFGHSVAISGTRVVVGAYGDDRGATNAGSAYVYNLSSATPTVPVTLTNPSPAGDIFFGRSVAISGTRVVVGADAENTFNAGSAYVYDLSSGTPTVPVFTLNNPSQANTNSQRFGRSVAISGTRLVVGAPSAFDTTAGTRSGMAYAYDLSSGTPTVPVATLKNPTPAASDYFGDSVAISGTRVVVGAFRDDAGATDAGRAYVYDLTNGTPTLPVATLNNLSPAVDDNFGYSVAISGTRVVVGANLDDAGAVDSGRAYVYDLSSGTPTVPVATLNKPGPAEDDNFGQSVAIDGVTAVIGAPFDDSAYPNKGFAYVFGPPAPEIAVEQPVANHLSDGGSAPSFGSIEVGSSGPAVIFTIRNLGGSNLTGLVISKNGTHANDYVVSTTGMTTTVSPGGSTTFTVTFSPGGTGARTAALHIANNDANENSFDLNLTGVGVPPTPEIAVEQPVASQLTDGGSAPAFGSFRIGTSSPAKAFTIRNVGLANLTGLMVTRNGTHAADFVVSTTGMAATLSPGGSTTFSVTFSPGGVASANRTAALHIASNDANENPFDINLTGVGLSSTADTDGDGLGDWAETQYAPLGFDWQVSQTALVTTLNSGANTANLYTLAQVQALNVDAPLLQKNPTTGLFTLTIGVQKATQLTNFIAFPMNGPGSATLINGAGKLEFRFTPADNAAFFRLQSQ